MRAFLRDLGLAIVCAATSSGCVEVVLARPPVVQGSVAVVHAEPVAPAPPVVRGRLGFEFRSYESGACLVTVVYPGHSADLAGLRVGDFILAVDGTAVGAPNCTQPLLGSRRPGELVTLRVCRDTTAVDLPARLEADDTGLFLRPDAPIVGSGPRPACAP